VILPDKTGEDSLLSTVSQLPGVFVPREGSPFPPPSPESSLSDSVYEPPGLEVPNSSEEGMSDSVSGDRKSAIPAVMNSAAVEKGWDEVAKLFYDGTTPIEVYFTRFDFFVKRLLRLDPDIEDEECRMRPFIQLRDARKLPTLGLDGERYVGPETWAVRQPDENINSYDKLCAALKDRYGRHVRKTNIELIQEIDQMHPNWKKTTLKEFFSDVDTLLGTAIIKDGFVIRALNEKLPIEVKEELRRSHGVWKKMTLSSYREYCMGIYEDIHYPDPTLLGRGKGMDAEASKKELQLEKDQVAMLWRQVEELSLLNKHHIDAQKRFANSDDAKRTADQRDGAVCWNCWEKGHVASTCQPR